MKAFCQKVPTSSASAMAATNTRTSAFARALPLR